MPKLLEIGKQRYEQIVQARCYVCDSLYEASTGEKSITLEPGYNRNYYTFPCQICGTEVSFPEPETNEQL